jgi:hypothetical protein
MIGRILFLLDIPFNQPLFQRFGVELLLENGFNVAVWDLTNILHPDLAKNYQPPDPIDWPGCKTFNNKKVALEEMRNLPSATFIINFIGYSPKSYCVYRAISASQAEYAVSMAGAIPSPYMGISKRERIFSYLKRLDKVSGGELVNYIANYSFYHLPFTWLGLKPASLILAGGKESLVYPYPVNKSTEILWAHSLDYDLYLKERNVPPSERPIAVFLDEYLPFHPDYLHAGIQAPITADRYYPLLNRFFSLAERELGLKVVIAAHPRSHYEKPPDYFEGRELVRGKTIQLVRQSQLVLSHYSTALSFANLFHKPVMFLTSSDLDKSWLGPSIRVMANWFGKTPICTDGDAIIDWAQELTVNRGHYEHYRQAYIKTEHSEGLPFWQIVANRLRKG